MPTPILGTAYWGWKIPAPTAFDLLDALYAAGFREIDTATNYPINKIPEDFRKAEMILSDWINAHGIRDLKITAKVGSINNLRSPEHLLTQSFLLMCLDAYHQMWGANLDTFMVHWDNRDARSEIRDTMEALAYAGEKGWRPGLSGILRPDIYADLNKDFGLDFRIQFKHNILESKYEHYKPFHGAKRFVAYGINAGGAKIGADPRLDFLKPILEKANERKDRPPIEHFFQVGILFAYLHPDMESILIGPSSVEQLEKNLAFFRRLEAFDYTDFFEPQRR
ncbi:MAG: aldo/keto reductase [Lewinellaceae bacterium]|nr:aldo/keto reductase [Lewinellaceae bacterium]